MTDQEQQRQAAVYKDLLFLLAPSSWDGLSDVFSAIIGSKLELLRQEANLALRDLALQLDIGIDALNAMEHQYKNFNASLKHYFLYLQYFGISFSDIFDVLKPDRASHNMHQKNEAEFLLNKVKQAIVILQRDDQKITYDAISNYLQIPLSHLAKDAEVQSFMKLYERRNKYQMKHDLSENKLLEDAIAAVKQLQVSESEITQAAVSRIMGISHTILKYYPRVKAYLEEQMRNVFRRNIEALGKNEQEITSTIKSVIERRKSRQQQVRFGGVAKDLKLNTDLLYEKPTIVALIQQAVNEEGPLRQCEQELLLTMKEAIAACKESGVELTLQLLAEAVGLRLRTLYYYQAVLDLARQALEEANQRYSREAKLFERAEEAIQCLHLSGKPITLCAVARELEMSSGSLSTHPKIPALIREEKKKKIHPMRNEQEIIKKVEDIIDLFKKKEERITIKAVAKELGVSTTYLYYYADAMAKIRFAIQEENYIAIRKEQHRHQVFLQVQVAVERLRVKREPLTVKAIAKETGKGRTTLLLYPEIMSYIRRAMTENTGGAASSRFSQEFGLDSNS